VNTLPFIHVIIASLQQQFMLGNYSFQIKALDPVNNTVQEGYKFVKPIKISMFYDVGNLVNANRKHVNNELTKEDVDPVLYLWDPENETWYVCVSVCLFVFVFVFLGGGVGGPVKVAESRKELFVRRSQLICSVTGTNMAHQSDRTSIEIAEIHERS